MTILIARWQNCHGLTNWHNSPKSPSWSSCTPSAQGKRTENWFSFALRDSGLAEVTLFLMAHGKLPQLSDAQQPVTAHPLCLEVCWAMEKWPKPSALTHRAGQGKTEAEMDAGTSGKKRVRLSDTASFSSTQFWEPASAVEIKWIHRVNPQRALPIPVSDPSSLLCIAGIPVGPWHRDQPQGDVWYLINTLLILLPLLVFCTWFSCMIQEWPKNFFIYIW